MKILVAKDGSGDGDGMFYLEGGEIVSQSLLEKTLDYAEGVSVFYRIIFLYIFL